MYSPFYVVVDKRCETATCSRYQKSAGVHASQCEECDASLVPVMGTNRRAVVLAGAAAVLLLVGILSVIVLVLTWRAEKREAQLLAQARDRFVSALEGATSSDVDRIAAAVQAELRLTDELRRRVVDAARSQVENLPRALTPELERQLESLLRDLYSDETISPDERAEIDGFVASQKLVPRSAEEFETELERRLRGAHRNLSRGEALVRQHMVAEARREFLAATEIDPNNAMAWANLGAAHALAGRTDEALACYDKAIELDAGNWLAHYNLGLAAARKDDKEAALRHFQQALASLPVTASQERRAVIRDLLEEPALAELRKDTRFADLLEGSATPGR